MNIKATVRLIPNPTSCLLAKADIESPRLTIRGFAIMRSKNPSEGPWVSMPATKNGTAYVNTVEIHDQVLKTAVTQAILEAYREAQHAADQAAAPMGGGQDELAF